MTGDATVDRCESPQVSEYRSRLQRTQSSRHSRIRKTKLQVVLSPTPITQGNHLQSGHRTRTPWVCTPTTDSSESLLSTPTRRRSKSEPCNSSPRRSKRSPARGCLSPPAQHQQIPFAADRFRNQGYHLDPSQRSQPSPTPAVASSRVSQSPSTLSKTPIPPGTLNQVALANQRRKLNRLAQLHTSTAAKDNKSNVNSRKNIMASPSSIALPRGINEKPRSQSTGRLRDDVRLTSPPILLEPHFLAAASSSPSTSTEEGPQPLPKTSLQILAAAPSSTSTSTEEGPQPLPKNSSQLPSTYSSSMNGNLDFHARSGTGFLTSTKPTWRHSKTITAGSAQPQTFNRRPKRLSEDSSRIPPPSTSHNSHHLPVTETTTKTPKLTKPTSPPKHPRTMHTRSRSVEFRSSTSWCDRATQGQSLRSHSVACVGRPPLRPAQSEKQPDNAKYANRNDELSNNESICENGNDNDHDDDETTSEFSQFVADDDLSGCGDPCSSSNIRSGIRAGQSVAERLSTCLVVPSSWTSPAEEPTTPRRRSRSSNAASRPKRTRPPSSLCSMDDNDAYFLSERRWRQKQHEEEWENSQTTPNLSHDSSLTKQRSHDVGRADGFVACDDDNIVKENVSPISRGPGSCDSSWGPVPPPPPLEHVDQQQSPPTSSDRDQIGPPQIILKIRRRPDHHSPTSILQDPFDPPVQHGTHHHQHQNIAQYETSMSALTLSVSPEGYTSPRRPAPTEQIARSRDNDGAKLGCHNSATSNPYDESSTQRRHQLLLGAMRTRSVEPKPFDERSVTSESPRPIRSLLDSTLSSGQHLLSMEQPKEQPIRRSASTNCNPQHRPPLGTSNSLLRDVRLELFQRGRGDNGRSPTPLSENRCTLPTPKSVSFSDDCSTEKLDELAGRALDCLRHKELVLLEQKLSENGAVLEQTKRDLELSRAETAQRSQRFELASANIFKERIEVEEKLRQEILSNEQIKAQMKELQMEVARLGNAIESTEVTTTASGDGDKTAQAVERLSIDLLSLRSEVVDLRAQLAESQAASITKDDVMATLRCERDAAQSQLSELNQQVKLLERDAITLRAKATLASVQQDKDVKNRCEERIKILQEDLEAARRQIHDQAETKKALERQLAEVQAVTVHHTKEVDDLKQQLEQTQRDAEEKVSAGDAETRKLQMELREIKEKLSHTNSEIINQAAAHLKENGRLQSELEQTRQVAQVLQNKVSNMDQDLAAILEENEKQKCVVDEAGRASNIGSASTVFLDLIRKTLDQTSIPSPSE